MLALLVPLSAAAGQSVEVLPSQGVPQADFAAREIQDALRSAGKAELREGASIRIVIAASADAVGRLTADLSLPPLKSTAGQAYALRKKAEAGRITYVVVGADPIGAMYGGLDLAERIRDGTLAALVDSDHAPYIVRRGIKFNIPLDARTPSYSDAGDAAQQNIPEMWSMAFWHEFLDEMARDRFNVLSLWNLHPFPSIVKVPEYPDVALDDVMRTTAPFDTTYNLTGSDMVRPNQLAHLEIVKRMTIEEKIQFWRDVMQYASDRGIEVYLFTWNIFTWGAEGRYGITSAQDNPTTIDYFRKSVRETLLTYPLLAGFGITSGEHMQNLKGDLTNEKWLWRAYGEGIRDVKRLQPDRSIRLIHRLHETNFKKVMADWKDYPDTFDFSYKYSVAHMYSMAVPSFARKDLADLPPNLRTWMTVRNDDIYSFRWGDPAYARAFVLGLPGPDKLAGYYMGPDGYIWGREFISTEPDAPRQLVIKKQWYSFRMWGWLSYDPALDDGVFLRALAARYPEAPAATLFDASSAASRIIPQTTRFFWKDIDLKWFPEACMHHPDAFYSVKDFLEGQTMPDSGIINIRTYRDRLLAKSPMNGITPLEVADALESDSATTLRLLEQMPQTIADKELRLTVGDLRAMAHLGNYYGQKIRGATDLALYDKTGDPAQQAAAVKHLEAAVDHWKQYAAIASSQYRPQLLTRIGHVDLNALTAKAAEDVTIARDWIPGK